jgi:hypothetical protein
MALAVWIAASCLPDLPSDLVALSEGGAGPLDGIQGTGEETSSSSSGSSDAGDDSAPVVGSTCGDGYIDLAGGEQCDPPNQTFCTADCKVNCPGGFVWPKNNHCYQLLATSERNYPNGAMSAVGLCSQAAPNGHPVTFASEEEYQAVLAYYADAGGGGAPFWIGLIYDSPTPNGHYASAAPYESGYRPSCPGCYAHTPDPSAFLQGNQMGCVQAAPAAHPTAWQTTNCYNVPPTRVLCEREPSTTPGSQTIHCDAGLCIDLVWTYPKKTYVYVESPASPDDAAQHCRTLGGHLVVLESQDEREQLWYQLSRPSVTTTPSQFWIGLARDGGSWVWDDDAGADAYPPEWAWSRPMAPGPGVQTRAYLYYLMNLSFSTLAFNDAPLTATLTYVCELPGPDAGM